MTLQFQSSVPAALRRGGEKYQTGNRSKILTSLAWIAFTLVACTAASSLGPEEVTGPPGGAHRKKVVVRLQNFAITPVEGKSWLNRLQMPLQQTSMGKTGTWGPAPYGDQRSQQQPNLPPDLFSKTMSLRGADFYRLDCQSCHRADGGGSPPEVNSLIDPVRATSIELVLQRMAKVRAPVEPRAVRQLASQAEASLLQRINHGGQKMPPFPDLNELEVQALIVYLKQLAGVPGVENHQLRVEEPVARVGEHLVKGTCHICHSATGQVPSPQELLDGAVPPLSNLTRSKTLLDFVSKVTAGAPIVMGGIQQQYRGRMPVFYYLRNDEAAAAYLYLSLYAPKDFSSAAGPDGVAAPRATRYHHGEY